MGLRDTERSTTARIRSEHSEDCTVAEDVLDFGARILSNRRFPHPEGDARLGRIIIGHLFKILHVHWAIIVVAERGLPSSTLMRELAEAVISLAYLLAEDSVARAELYRGHMVARDLKDMNRRLNDPESRDVVTLEYRQRVEENVQAIVTRKSQAQWDAMKDWPTWAGPFSIEVMARRAGIPSPIYTMLYAVESRATHAMDITSHVAATTTGDLVALLPESADRHLISSSMLTVTALHLADRVFGLGHESEIDTMRQRIEGRLPSAQAGSIGSV